MHATHRLALVQLGQQRVEVLLREVAPLHVAQQHNAIRLERVQSIASLLQGGFEICMAGGFLTVIPNDTCKAVFKWSTSSKRELAWHGQACKKAKSTRMLLDHSCPVLVQLQGRRRGHQLFALCMPLTHATLISQMERHEALQVNAPGVRAWRPLQDCHRAGLGC